MKPTSLRVATLNDKHDTRTIGVARINAAQLDEITTAAAVTKYNNKRMQRVLGRGEASFDSPWMGNIGSLDNARRLFSGGWQEGAERASLLRDSIGDVVPNSAAPRRVRRFGDDGDEVRVEQALRGEWDSAFVYTRKELAPAANVVSIACGWWASCGVNHKDLLWNAVQAIVICDLLENAGYRVELRALDAIVVSPNKYHINQMMMKRPDEPLQADLVAATIGHAGVYRSLGFALECCHLTDTDEVLGSVVAHEKKEKLYEKAIAEQELEPISYIIPRGDSQDTCISNIKTALKKLAPTAAAH